MDIAPFEAPRLKVKRANALIFELESTFNDYAASRPCHIILEDDEVEAGRQNWRLRLLKPRPKLMATILGDVFHNLRSALDHMANDVVAESTGEPSGSAKFPTASSLSQLPGQIKEKKFHKASPEAIALLTSVAPYQSGNVALRALHDLNIDDKHRALVPVMNGVAVPTITRPNFIAANNRTLVAETVILSEVRTLQIPFGTEM